MAESSIIGKCSHCSGNVVVNSDCLRDEFVRPHCASCFAQVALESGYLEMEMPPTKAQYMNRRCTCEAQGLDFCRRHAL